MNDPVDKFLAWFSIFVGWCLIAVVFGAVIFGQ